MCLDEVLGDAERGRTLRGVENRQPAARAGSEIMEVAARTQSHRDLIDGAGYLLERRVDRFDRAPVLAVHELEQLSCAQAVHRVGARVCGLAHPPICPINTSAAARPQTRAAP